MGSPAVSEKAPDLRVYMLAALLRTRALDPLGSSLHSCTLMMLLFAWETGCLINEMQVWVSVGCLTSSMCLTNSTHSCHWLLPCFYLSLSCFWWLQNELATQSQECHKNTRGSESVWLWFLWNKLPWRGHWRISGSQQRHRANVLEKVKIIWVQDHTFGACWEWEETGLDQTLDCACIWVGSGWKQCGKYRSLDANMPSDSTRCEKKAQENGINSRGMGTRLSWLSCASAYLKTLKA